MIRRASDVSIAKVAATAELLAIDVYARALAARSGGKFVAAQIGAGEASRLPAQRAGPERGPRSRST